jgi:hypothetical protein
MYKSTYCPAIPFLGLGVQLRPMLADPLCQRIVIRCFLCVCIFKAEWVVSKFSHCLEELYVELVLHFERHERLLGLLRQLGPLLGDCLCQSVFLPLLRGGCLEPLRIIAKLLHLFH